MTAEEYRKYLQQKKLGRGRKNKYGAKKTELKGEAKQFPSRGEAHAFAAFRLREQAGEISQLTRYPTVLLTAAEISYKPDWLYMDTATGELRYVDFKGVRGERFNLIKRLWKFYGPAPLEVWEGDPAICTETIRPR